MEHKIILRKAYDARTDGGINIVAIFVEKMLSIYFFGPR